MTYKQAEEIYSSIGPGLGKTTGPKFRTQYNYEQETPQQSEKPSLTIPGQSATVREMYARAMRGEPINQNQNLLYTGDEFVPNIDKMDPVDRDTFIQNIVDLKQQIDENNALNEAQKQEAKAKLEADQYQKWMEKYHAQQLAGTPQAGTQAASEAK